MWSSTRTVAPIPSSAIVQFPISDNFRIKGTHMQMIWDNQFDGRIRSDPHRHVANFLEISSLFQYVENQDEAVMLRTFPFPLSGESKTCFHQLAHETLVDAWLRIKEMLCTCYGHGLTKGTIVHIFYHGLDGPTQGILDTGGIFLYNTLNEAFKFLQDKKLEDLTTKIDLEFLIIRKELKEMQDSRGGGVVFGRLRHHRQWVLQAILMNQIIMLKCNDEAVVNDVVEMDDAIECIWKNENDLPWKYRY
ncbi:hypothetical protein Tco_0792707 [Tanacetum coccineum]